METRIDQDADSVKLQRHRKKKILQKLRVLMEFYFSAPNLSKDTFLQQLLHVDPYIDLKVFLAFNKIKTLTDDVSLIQKAVSNSELLQLSEDGCRVKRKFPLEEKEDEDECTIYVENLPPSVEHTWIYEVFSQYGPIDYISLPRFRNTRKPKGFAFVEFSIPSCAHKALEAFGMHTDVEPSELQSVKTYDGLQVNMITTENTVSLEEVKINDDDDDDTKKRKHESNVEITPEKMPHKKIKTAISPELEDLPHKFETVEGLRIPPKYESSQLTKTAKDPNLTCELEDLPEKLGSSEDPKILSKLEECPEEGQDSAVVKVSPELKDLPQEGENRAVPMTSPKHEELPERAQAIEDSKSYLRKKKRKRRRKAKEYEVDSIFLRVMSKKDWKGLRNKYLNEQRKNMRKLKANLKAATHEAGDFSVSCKVKGDKPVFHSGLIAKVTLHTPITNIMNFRGHLTQQGVQDIAYIEFSADSPVVHIRFHSAGSASAALKALECKESVIIGGTEEEEYWRHVVSSWEKKRESAAKCNEVSSRRGRDKILSKAVACYRNSKLNSHVIFND